MWLGLELGAGLYFMPIKVLPRIEVQGSACVMSLCVCETANIKSLALKAISFAVLISPFLLICSPQTEEVLFFILDLTAPTQPDLLGLRKVVTTDGAVRIHCSERADRIFVNARSFIHPSTYLFIHFYRGQILW